MHYAGEQGCGQEPKADRDQFYKVKCKACAAQRRAVLMASSTQGPKVRL